VPSRRDTPGDLGVVGVGAIAEAIVRGLCEGTFDVVDRALDGVAHRLQGG